MKILHFLWALDNGGAENLAVDLANEQSRDNVVIFLVANERVDDAVRVRLAPAVRFVCLGRPQGSRNPYWIVRLLYELHALAPDVVHAHSNNLVKLHKFIAAELVLTVHDMHIALTDTTAYFSLVCCISKSVLNDVRMRYPMLRVRQVNNGVMVAQIATCERLPSSTVRSVQISRLVHDKKGQDLLINALAIVNAQPNRKKLTIDFIGDGPSLTYLMALASDVGVAEYCHFIGAMSRTAVYQRLCTYDILVQPSRYEGFGLTVAEGMAAGVPVVVSDIEGPMEIIANGEFGHYFKTNDVGSLAEALQKAIALIGTPEESARLGSARNHVAKKFDLAQTSRQYCDIYKEVIGG